MSLLFFSHSHLKETAAAIASAAFCDPLTSTVDVVSHH